MEKGYCVKCKAKRGMENTKQVAMKSRGTTKRFAMKGTCEKCNTGMYRILPAVGGPAKKAAPAKKVVKKVAKKAAPKKAVKKAAPKKAAKKPAKKGRK
ncbi:MAG: DUF5679 domain-containing protein [Candidatus Gracilibacteria bacterium]